MNINQTLRINHSWIIKQLIKVTSKDYQILFSFVLILTYRLIDTQLVNYNRGLASATVTGLYQYHKQTLDRRKKLNL
jgi:hypothetical protein